MKGSRFLATASCALAAAMLITSVPAPAAAKEAGDLLVRLRGIWVAPSEDSNLQLGSTDIPGEASVDNSVVPELDFTYFLTDNIGVELILGTTPHEVEAVDSPLGASVDLGDVWLLPPTLTVQYHLMPKGDFSPYVGAGVNYTIFYGEDSGAALSIDYENSFGFALQAGFDYKIGDNLYLNVDVKKLWLQTDVTVDAGLTSDINADVDLDPWIVGVGVGMIF